LRCPISPGAPRARARSLGRSKSEFQKELRESREEDPDRDAKDPS
jgi:hypothetical protein